jgi:WS/DGAT/MGAT family acyltransferase
MSRYARLTAFDRLYLRDETPDWPCHFGGLAVVEGGALLDSSGQLRLEEIQARLDRRMTRVPDLRQRLHLPGPLRGGPLWVDDRGFAIGHHVRRADVPSPGDEAMLLETAARVYAGLLDRARPLWELWFLTGLADGRVGVLLKLHHAVADGNAAVAIMGSLFDAARDGPDPDPAPWRPGRVPRESALLVDNVTDRLRSLGHAATLLVHPRRLVGSARVLVLVARRSLGSKGAPGTSLNRPVRAGRRIGVLRLDLAAVKEAGHAHEGTVNDVVLDLWSGGLRRLLASRGEPVAGVELITAQAVSTRSADDDAIDNKAGTAVFPLPVREADVHRRLDLIVGTTRRVKAGHRPAAIMGALVALSGTPLGRYLNLHQRATNVIVTNVVGPPVPMYILGAPILEILPIIQLVGNIGLTLCAFSYAGRLSLVVTADATGFPDLDVLIDGMEQDWRELAGGRVAEPVPA